MVERIHEVVCVWIVNQPAHDEAWQVLVGCGREIWSQVDVYLKWTCRTGLIAVSAVASRSHAVFLSKLPVLYVRLSVKPVAINPGTWLNSAVAAVKL